MQFVYILFAIGILSPIITVRSSEDNVEAKNIEPIRIVLPSRKTFRYVDNNMFEGILSSKEIKDCHVSVVSITGNVQTGRSLLLNFFLNYLRTQYKTWNPFTKKLNEPLLGDDWMNMNITHGFKIEANSKGTTKGVWAWPEIFISGNTTPNVAIILLDTEGLYHHKNDIRRDTMTFALSATFSSMLCYSDYGLGSVTLNILDVFIAYTMYGIKWYDETTMKVSTNTTIQPMETPFESLNFIMRDWQCEYESGDEFLERVLYTNASADQTSCEAYDDAYDETYGQTHDETYDRTADESAKGTYDGNRDMKERITSVFKSIHAFHVTLTPKDAKKRTFDGNLSHIDPLFIEHVKAMVPTLLTPENIIIKKINGKPVKAGELPYFFKAFTDIVGNMKITTSLLESIVNASNWRIYDDCMNLYQYAMSVKLDEVKRTGGDKPYYDQDEFERIHSEKKNASMEQFDKDVNIDVNKLAQTYRALLNQEIEKLFGIFNKTNQAMTESGQLKLVDTCWRLYNESMRSKLNALNESDSERSYYEPVDFEHHHHANRNASMRKFQDQVKQAVELETKLSDRIASSFNSFNQTNEQMRQKYLNSKTIIPAWVSWVLIGLSVTVVSVYALSKLCLTRKTKTDEENGENEKTEEISSKCKLEKV